MFQVKAGFLDRVEQSFLIFRDNALALSIPPLVFQCIFLAVIPLVFGILFNQAFSLDKIIPQGENIMFNTSTSIALVFWVSIVGILVLAYLILMIVIQLGTLQSIKQAISGTKPTPKENILQYGLQNLWASFKTYWYIFAYVALIPALIFIFGGVLFILSQTYFSQDIVRDIAIAIMIISALVFIVFAVYRGIRSTFSLVHAVDKQSFTKENFQNSLTITKWKWWNITWNIVLVSFIGGLATSLLGNLAGSIGFLWQDFSLLAELPQDGSKDYLTALKQFTEFNVFRFIGSTLKIILSTLLSVYLSVFIYVMMRSLQWKPVETKIDSPATETGEL
jgi:hypothetical protein